MPYSVPLTAVANASLTAAQWNASVRDNILETVPAKATTDGQHFVSTGAGAVAARKIDVTSVATADSTTSTSYVALASAGPALTASTGPGALVAIHSRLTNNTLGAFSYSSFEVSGASTQAANDFTMIGYESSNANDNIYMSGVWVVILNAGSNTFTMRYRVNANTGTFENRRLSVVPF